MVFIVAILMVALTGVSVIPTRAAGQTIVTIQFDDGVADPYTAHSTLDAHGKHATFFGNSRLIGDSAHMTWAQLQDLSADGNEIGDHTFTPVNLKRLKTAPARQVICGDHNSKADHQLCLSRVTLIDSPSIYPTVPPSKQPFGSL